MTISKIADRLSFSYRLVNVIPKNFMLNDREDIPVKMIAEIFRREYPLSEVYSWKAETLLLPLRPLVPDHCYLRLGDRRVWKCKLLKDDKWLLKQIEIVDIAGMPFGTEGNKMEISKTNSIVTNALSMAGITISVELGTASKTVKEVFGMSEGSIVELDKRIVEPVDVKANGALFAKGEVVAIDDYFGVRIIEILGTPISLEKHEVSHGKIENE